MHTRWSEFLQQQGLNLDSQGHYEVCTPATHQANLCIPAQNGILSISGKDALRFMQGQFTCDLNEITPQQFRLGACCTPKGRMLASFTLSALPSAEPEYLLNLPLALLDKLQQHLSKYAVFFKTKMENKSDTWVQLNIVGEQALQKAQEVFNLNLDESFSSVALANTAIDQSDDLQGHLLIHDAQRISLNLPLEEAIKLWPLLTRHFPVTSSNAWPLACQQAGVGHVEPETAELFIPQMLNLQATGGISFKKGCYTGQEIIARMQFRGSLKRSMYRALLPNSSAPEAGTPIFAANKESAAGHIVSAVQQDNDCHLLLVLENDKTDQELFIQPDQNKIELLTLPYTLD